MKFSLRMVSFMVLWCCFVFSMARLAYLELSTPSFGSFIASDAVEFANILFAIGAVLIALARGAKEMFWLGVAVVAVLLVSLQVLELLPQQAAHRMAGELVFSVPDQSPSNDWDTTHTSQIQALILYSWTPLLAMFGGSFAVWWGIPTTTQSVENVSRAKDRGDSNPSSLRTQNSVSRKLRQLFVPG